MSDKTWRTLILAGAGLAAVYMLSQREDNGEDGGGFFPPINIPDFQLPDLSGLIPDFTYPDLSGLIPDITYPDMGFISDIIPEYDIGGILESQYENMGNAYEAFVDALGGLLEGDKRTDGTGGKSEGGINWPTIKPPTLDFGGPIGGQNIDMWRAMQNIVMANPLFMGPGLAWEGGKLIGKGLDKAFDVNWPDFEPVTLDFATGFNELADASQESFERSPWGVLSNFLRGNPAPSLRDAFPDASESELQRLMGNYTNTQGQIVRNGRVIATPVDYASLQDVPDAMTQGPRVRDVSIYGESYSDEEMRRVESTLPRAQAGGQPFSTYRGQDSLFLGTAQGMLTAITRGIRENLGITVTSGGGGCGDGSCQGISLEASSSLRHSIMESFGEMNPCDLVGQSGFQGADAQRAAEILGSIERQYNLEPYKEGPITRWRMETLGSVASVQKPNRTGDRDSTVSESARRSREIAREVNERHPTVSAL